MAPPFTRKTLLQASGAALAQDEPRRPNVLFLMADQLRYDCLGANGNPLIRTCVPSRVSYFTGPYPHSLKNRVNYTPCDRREVFLQRMLQDAGSQTGPVGKLHYYPPTAGHARTTGFDRVMPGDARPQIPIRIT